MIRSTRRHFSRRLVAISATAVAISVLIPVVAVAAGGTIKRPKDAKTWVTLPSSPKQDPHCALVGTHGGCPGHPEGMTVDSKGNMYVASFELPPGFAPNPDPGGPYSGNLIYVFHPVNRKNEAAGAKFAFSIVMPKGTAPLGMQFDKHGNLYVIDVFGGDVLKYKPPFSANSVPVADYKVCGGYFGTGAHNGPPATAQCALNGITADNSLQRPSPDGNIYMTDSTGGGIYELNITTCHSSYCGSRLLYDPRLLPMSKGPYPPAFGANGLAFDLKGKHLYVDNMSNGLIYRYPISKHHGTLVAGKGKLWAKGLAGPDDMVLDRRPGGLLWVSNGGKNQAVGLNSRGKVVEVLGSLLGVTKSGAPKGILQDSSIVRVGNDLYVDNEASPNLHPTPPQGWDAFKKFTVARVSLSGTIASKSKSKSSTKHTKPARHGAPGFTG